MLFVKMFKNVLYFCGLIVFHRPWNPSLILEISTPPWNQKCFHEYKCNNTATTETEYRIPNEDYKIRILLQNYYFKSAAAKSLQSCPTLCDPRDGSPPGSSIHGIFQARVLEWVVIILINHFFWDRGRKMVCPKSTKHSMFLIFSTVRTNLRILLTEIQDRARTVRCISSYVVQSATIKTLNSKLGKG